MDAVMGKEATLAALEELIAKLKSGEISCAASGVPLRRNVGGHRARRWRVREGASAGRHARALRPPELSAWTRGVVGCRGTR